MAKTHRPSERLEDSDTRRSAPIAKNAFDIYRLLLAVDTEALAAEFRLLRADEISSRVTPGALWKFRDLFSKPLGTGTNLAV